MYKPRWDCPGNIGRRKGERVCPDAGNGDRDDCHEIKSGCAHKCGASGRCKPGRARAASQTKPRLHEALAQKCGKSVKRKAAVRRTELATEVRTGHPGTARGRNTQVRLLPSRINHED